MNNYKEKDQRVSLQALDTKLHAGYFIRMSWKYKSAAEQVIGLGTLRAIKRTTDLTRPFAGTTIRIIKGWPINRNNEEVGFVSLNNGQY